MRISDWSSDVCSSDLALHAALLQSPGEDRAVLNLGGIANLTLLPRLGEVRGFDTGPANGLMDAWCLRHRGEAFDRNGVFAAQGRGDDTLLARLLAEPWFALRSEEHTSDLQSLMRISYAVFCLKKK